jgi:amidohydrolase
MHACGHDGHTSMLVGSARALSQERLRERLSGTVKFVFQPAEEGYAGGRAMVEEGVTDDLRSIFALHLWPGLPLGTAATKAGPMMAASDAFELSIKGTGGHGAMPHQTADAIAIAAQVVTALQTIVSREVNPVEPAVLTVGEIGAGAAFNIIPETARLGGTVRTLNNDLREKMPERIKELARGQPLDGRRRLRVLLGEGAGRLHLARRRERLGTAHLAVLLRRGDTLAGVGAPRSTGARIPVGIAFSKTLTPEC